MMMIWATKANPLDLNDDDYGSQDDADLDEDEDAFAEDFSDDLSEDFGLGDEE